VSESNLIEQARRGDETAWTTLVRQHQEAVFRLAYLLLGDPDDAQDVAQEAFIRAFYALNRFDNTRPLRPWLLRITVNLVHNKRRALGRYVAALGRWFQREPDRMGPSPHDEHLQQWEAQTLWQAVRQLSLTDQEIIYLRYFLELSVAETAEAAEIAPGTVKSRLHRALERLRKVIAAEFPALQEERVR
jgi:RNA polymerase sigma-70 factor (ECF subfamily)